MLNVASSQLQCDTLHEISVLGSMFFFFFLCADHKEVGGSHLLLQRVVLPDHVPSALQERCRDPAIRYPLSQENEAREPNENPHERELKVPCIGA